MWHERRRCNWANMITQDTSEPSSKTYTKVTKKRNLMYKRCSLMCTEVVEVIICKNSYFNAFWKVFLLTLTQSTGYITQCSIIPAMPPAMRWTDIRSVGRFSYSSSSIVKTSEMQELFSCVKNEKNELQLTCTSAIFKSKVVVRKRSGFGIVIPANHIAVVHASSRVT